MLNTSLHPFESVRQAAETLTDLRAKSQLLAELAQNQMAAGQFDAALQTFATIPSAQERRIALLTANYQSYPPEKIEPLVQLLESDARRSFVFGNIALSMLNVNNVKSAWKLVETVDEPFESEQQRYDFLEKVLTLINESDWEKVLRFRRMFVNVIYLDWATLAIVKYLTKQQRYGEVETFVASISMPILRSWAYWEMFRLSSAEQSQGFFDKALEMIETVEITPDEEEMEKFAIQLRILGRAAFQRGKRDQGERLLERSEAAIDCLAVPMQRYRLRCFLGKVLVELRLIGSIREYLPIDDILGSLSSGFDRSQVSVWLAEAGWKEGWARAIDSMAAPGRGVTELERARRIAEILNRFAYHEGYKETGDTTDDVARFSGEKLEALYFNPFAMEDCGC